MATRKTVVYYSAVHQDPCSLVERYAEDRQLSILSETDAGAVVDLLNRSFPVCVVLDAGKMGERAVELCTRLKGDPFTAIVPVVLLASDGNGDMVAVALEAGADEVIPMDATEREQQLRLEVVLRRADRDVSVHPTTRLPGTAQIERDLGERLERGELFAICYADLDHFKEFNDRYGYNQGDRVIKLLSRILRDIVRAHAPTGFIGHIGGDDFIFTVPLEHMEICSEEILELFDELIPYQYTEEDRSAGYFLGKDRRGNIHRIPLMTLSIGIVTNQHHRFSHTAQLSELATEMKSYAKTLPGSVYVVDRRQTKGPASEDSSEDRREAPAAPPTVG